MTKHLATLPPRLMDGIGLGLLLAIAGAAYMLGVHPALDRRAAADRDRALLTTELASADSAVQGLKAAESTRDAIVAKRQGTLSLEPTEQVNSRISRLTSLAAEESVAIQQLTPGNPKSEAGKPFSSVPIRVQGTGEFADCIAFLARLRDQHRDIAVPSIHLSISQPASENQAARLDMTLELVWYAAPDDSAGRK